MKQLLILICLSTVAVFSFAQDEKPEEIQNIIKNNQERFVFELTHDRALGDGAPEIATLSRGGNVYYTKNIPLGESNFSVAPGIGIANRQLYMKNVYLFDPGTALVTLPEVPDSLDRNSSKLAFTYLEIPVELRWNSQPNKRGHVFKVATGFRAGYLIGRKFKYNGQVYEGNEFLNDSGSDLVYSEKFKVKQLENMIKYRVAPSFRIGYGSVNLFGLYHLNRDFEIGRGPEMNGYSFGLSISSF